jgi:uncharacterized protein
MPPKAFGDFLYQIWQLWRGEGRPFAIHPFEEWDRGGSTNCQLSGTCAQHLLALDNRGNIFQCGRFAELGDPEGNLQEEPLVKILRNPRRLELSQRSSILKAGHCRGCLYWEACHGGCPHHAYLHSGNAMTPTPFCQAIKTFFHQVSEGVAASPEKERENC